MEMSVNEHSERLWPVLSSSKETSFSSYDRIVCLLWPRTETNKVFLKAKRMKWIIPKEENDPSNTIQQKYPFEAKYRNLIKASHEV